MQAKLLGELRFTAEVNILLRCALQASLVRRRPKKKKKKVSKSKPKNEASKYRMGQQKSQKSFRPSCCRCRCLCSDPAFSFIPLLFRLVLLWVLCCVLVCVTIFYSFMHFGNKNFIFCLTKWNEKVKSSSTGGHSERISQEKEKEMEEEKEKRRKRR